MGPGPPAAVAAAGVPAGVSAGVPCPTGVPGDCPPGVGGLPGVGGAAVAPEVLVRRRFSGGAVRASIDGAAKARATFDWRIPCFDVALHVYVRWRPS